MSKENITIQKKCNITENGLIGDLFNRYQIKFQMMLVMVLLLCSLAVGLFFCGHGARKAISSCIGYNKTSTLSINNIKYSYGKENTKTVVIKVNPVNKLPNNEDEKFTNKYFMPNCIVSTGFPTRYRLNDIIFWNTSKINYSYWGLDYLTSRIFVIHSQIGTETSFKVNNLNNAPTISYISLKYPNTSEEILSKGKNNFPPFWYMEWEDISSGLLYRPIFQPCIGSLYTYTSKGKPFFFDNLNTVFSCKFKLKADNLSLVEIDNVAFIKVNLNGKGSSNQLIQLFLQLCLLRSENLWVVSFTRFSNKVNPQSTCIDMKSWLLYTKESSFISLEHGIWFGRDSKGEFHITNGLFQTEVCYQSWWTLYGGTDYSQFVPQISS
ncbi:hypothetical protein cand_029330 [Cryptosporidium andersoni]|uniref:Uncharacterized protein n=1 Tax=Cryptosporidium andersoni TaxID=117008 RepID=A0A1J4MNG5_9CRYT|nr:hypothetical protein cand_029330 [Cryptosporidium andersoni]